MAFPVTAPYIVNFRPTDSGLGPTYPKFQDINGDPAYMRLDEDTQLPPPAFEDLGMGRYRFWVTWASAEDPDILCTVDGGPSIVPEERRFLTAVLSARPFIVPEGGTGGGGGSAVVG